jgi:integrase
VRPGSAAEFTTRPAALRLRPPRRSLGARSVRPRPGCPCRQAAASGRAPSGHGLVYEEPKADRSRRTLALPVPLVEALRVHRAAQREERITACPLWEDHDLVFAQPNGRPIERKSDWRSWKALLREADVREVRLHDGRHTAATLLLSEGVHPRVVMEVLGHAQMRTTTDTYSHVMPALGRDAADRMGSALWD